MKSIFNHPELVVYAQIYTRNSPLLYFIIHSVVVDNLSCGHILKLAELGLINFCVCGIFLVPRAAVSGQNVALSNLEKDNIRAYFLFRKKIKIFFEI